MKSYPCLFIGKSQVFRLLTVCRRDIFRSFSFYDTYARTPLIYKRSLGRVFNSLQKIAF